MTSPSQVGREHVVLVDGPARRSSPAAPQLAGRTDTNKAIMPAPPPPHTHTPIWRGHTHRDSLLYKAFMFPLYRVFIFLLYKAFIFLLYKAFMFPLYQAFIFLLYKAFMFPLTRPSHTLAHFFCFAHCAGALSEPAPRRPSGFAAGDASRAARVTSDD